MKVKLIFLLMLAPVAAGAEDHKDLEAYLRSKNIQCELTYEELNTQVEDQLERNVSHISDALKARGSEFDSIVQDRDQVEIGIFPVTVLFDFYVLEKIKVKINKFTFQIRTTYYTPGAQEPSTAQGLWFPLTVKDPGPNQPCRLQRVSVREDQRNFLPVVDLVIGDPPVVVAYNLANMVDIANPAARAEEKEKNPAPKEEQPREEAHEKPRVREARHHSREKLHPHSERHHERRHWHHYSHRRHRPAERETTGQVIEPPPKENGCTGDISPWKSVTCALTGKK